jgi:hypothetical protein
LVVSPGLRRFPVNEWPEIHNPVSPQDCQYDTPHFLSAPWFIMGIPPSTVHALPFFARTGPGIVILSRTNWDNVPPAKRKPDLPGVRLKITGPVWLLTCHFIKSYYGLMVTDQSPTVSVFR